MRVRSAAFWDYCEALVALSGRPRPAPEVLAPRLAAIEEGIGQATTYEWANLLTHHRAITGGGTQRVHANRVIEVGSWLRGAQLGFPRLCATASEPTELSATLADAGIPHAFGAITAANLWSFYEAASSIQLYVPPSAVAKARKELDHPGGRTRIEIFSQAPVSLPIAASNLASIAASCGAEFGQAYRDKDLARRSGASVPVTTRFVSMLDSRVHPEGASHAVFLRDQILSRVTE